MQSKTNIYSTPSIIEQKWFEGLFCEYYPQIAAYVNTILLNRDAADDITQEVFMYVWEKRNHLYIDDKFHAYLFQTAYSRCIDYIRKNKQKVNYAQQAQLRYACEHKEFLDEGCLQIKTLFSKDFEETLNTLLNQLPETRRKVFEYVYREGLKTKEVSEKLDIPQRTVENHIYLTLKYLREHLSPFDFFILSLFYHFL